MSSEGFQLSQTIGGGKALCMTIGSLTPVKLAGEGGGRGKVGGERGREREGVPICLDVERVSFYICTLHTDTIPALLLLFNFIYLGLCLLQFLPHFHQEQRTLVWNLLRPCGARLSDILSVLTELQNSPGSSVLSLMFVQFLLLPSFQACSSTETNCFRISTNHFQPVFAVTAYLNFASLLV